MNYVAKTRWQRGEGMTRSELRQRNTMLFFWTQALHAEKNYGSWLLSLKNGWKASLNITSSNLCQFASLHIPTDCQAAFAGQPLLAPGSRPVLPSFCKEIAWSWVQQPHTTMRFTTHLQLSYVLHVKKTSITKLMWVPIKFSLKLEIFFSLPLSQCLLKWGKMLILMDGYIQFFLFAPEYRNLFLCHQETVGKAIFFTSPELVWGFPHPCTTPWWYFSPGNRASCF